MTRGSFAGAVVTIVAGVWVVSQVTWGGALTRLGLLR
jgi:hypothetical protein